MCKLLLAFSLIFSSSFVWAQTPEDALRYGYPLMSGTARNQAIGGAGASLGGDITSAHINPAGIGLYKNRELVLSPGFNFINNNFTYRGVKDNKAKDNGFNLGTSGMVFGNVKRENPSNSSAFSISVTQLANYNNHVEYAGENKLSSWSEQYVEQLASDGASVGAAESFYPFGSSLAYWTFLVDTISDPLGNVSGYISQVPVPGAENLNGGVRQHNIIDTRGGAQEISVAFAANKMDRFYFGGSVNLPIYYYTKDQTYREEDISTDATNYFEYFEYKETYESNGLGLNLKLGAIFKPVDRLRLGLAFHTPTFASFTDRMSSSIVTNTENYTTYPQPLSKTSNELAGSPEFEYSLTTPLRVMASGSWVINEVKEVKQQKGFITADLEFVNYGGTRYSAMEEAPQSDIDYYDNLNDVIKDRYKGAVNIRLGGELKFNTIMGRAGFAYLSSPYKDKDLEGRRILASGGLGYRDKGFFVDLTYIHAFIKDTNVPYYLTDKASPIADGKNNRGNVVLTLGVKI